jgi:hypothetical protein
MRSTFLGLMALAIVFQSGSAAAITEAAKCKAAKYKIAGAYYSCREKAAAASLAKGEPADYSKCTARFDEKWDDAETDGATMCPDNVLTAAMNDFIADQAQYAAEIIAGNEDVPVCGDSLVNAVGEHCDGLNFDGQTCQSLGFEAGQLSCDGSCGLVASGCFPCPGFAYADACWFLGEYGLSCNTVCEALGLVYDDATRTVAGSDGTSGACRTVLGGIGFDVEGEVINEYELSQESGYGCCDLTTIGLTRAIFPSTSGWAQHQDAARACACRP